MQLDDPSADADLNEAASHGSGARKGCIVISGVILGAIGSMVVIAALLLTGVLHLSEFGIGAPQLPDYGRPPGSHQLDEDSLACSSAVNAEWCRTLMFGSDQPFDPIRQRLEATFIEHRWELTSSGDHPWQRLEVSSPTHSMCISYENIKASLQPLPDSLPSDWLTYDTLIDVWVLPCPAPPH